MNRTVPMIDFIKYYDLELDYVNYLEDRCLDSNLNDKFDVYTTALDFIMDKYNRGAITSLSCLAVSMLYADITIEEASHKISRGFIEVKTTKEFIEYSEEVEQSKLNIILNKLSEDERKYFNVEKWKLDNFDTIKLPHKYTLVDIRGHQFYICRY